MKYRCHKTVDAFEIGRIEGHTLFSVDGNTSYEVDEQYINRHPLNLPGYFVQYEDGYMSWSPKETFEAGYSLLDKRRIIHLKIAEEILTQAGQEAFDQISEMFRAAVEDRQGSIITTLPALDSGVITIDHVGDIDTEQGPREFVSISLMPSQLEITGEPPLEIEGGETQQVVGNLATTYLTVVGDDFCVPALSAYEGERKVRIGNNEEGAILLRGRSIDPTVTLENLAYDDLHKSVLDAIYAATASHCAKFNVSLNFKEVNRERDSDS